MFLRATAAIAAALVSTSLVGAQSDFVNWESPHVHPLELTPDGQHLLAVNTPDDRLEVFDASGLGLVRLFDVPVGLDPVSVRARTSSEIWVANHLSDSISVVDLATRRVVATLATDDEPTDVVFAGTPARAYVSCSQANTVLVFDPSDLALAPARIAIDGEEPRAMCVSLDGRTVYVAIFQSGNRSTVLGGGIDNSQGVIAFPPNVVNDPQGPWGGQNPPPNSGTSFEPPIAVGLPVPPRVSLIVKQDAQGRWMDDNGGDWTDLVSGPNAPDSGRVVGWELVDHDVAMIDTLSSTVRYARGLMNTCMAIATNPRTGEVTVVGTDGTNEIRFEPNLTGKFLRVLFASVRDQGFAVLGNEVSASLADLNAHLDYAQSTVPQSERDRSLGDPRGVAWRADGKRGYVTGMGSNNLTVIGPSGARAGKTPTIEVGEGPTGLVLHEALGRLYVLDKFESSISVVDLGVEREVARVPFHDPSPAAIKLGRKHLYDTRKNSGLGHIACASCHVDARMDFLAWDLGDPSGAMKPTTGQNVGAGVPGLGAQQQPFHPMKGPMTTQTLQDIIGKEPHHWRGDRDGLEEFNGAFIGLQGDDSNLAPEEMQEYEDFLATIAIPPNPFRNVDNTLPTDLPLTGHFTTGRFAPAGQPLPNGNAENGLALYRPPIFLDAGVFACVSCHTLPTGLGTDMRKNTAFGPFLPIPPGPNGERHHMLVTVDGSTNRVIKVPQVRTLYEKVGFDATQQKNHFGVGLLHDGSVDSIARFVAEPAFNVQNDQQIADLVAFMLAFSGSDLPQGAPNQTFEPPGTASLDSHAAVGKLTTLLSAASADPAQISLIATLRDLAQAGAIGMVAKGVWNGELRGWTYDGVLDRFQSDRAAESATLDDLVDAAAIGSEQSFLAVPFASETRIGIDRDRDGVYDRDELDAGTDPADPLSLPGGCTAIAANAPAWLKAEPIGTAEVQLTWIDASANEDGFALERAPAGSGQFQLLTTVAADVTTWPDTGLPCGQAFDYRVKAFNCATPAGFAAARASTGSCGSLGCPDCGRLFAGMAPKTGAAKKPKAVVPQVSQSH